MRKTLMASGAFVFVCSALAATTGHAQNFDHLKCYKIKDPHNFSAAADLTPFQVPPFAVELGCKIRVKGTEFCIPVDKALLPGSGTVPSAPVSGQPLQNDFICYNIKCPASGTTIPPVVASDQFGSRTLQKFRVKRLCVPAIKGLPPTTTTTTTTPITTTTTLPLCASAGLPACAGTCPSPQTCVKDSTTTFCLCCSTGGSGCVTTSDCCVPFTCVAGTCQ